jgi:hypothetical protein
VDRRKASAVVSASASEFESYQHSIEALIERLRVLHGRRELPAGAGDRIRFAVHDRHGGWGRFVAGTEAEQYALRFITILGDADDELTAAQVEKLEAMIAEGLPRIA